MASLTGKQYEQLEAALRSAFPDWNNLERMLMFKLDKRLGDVVAKEAHRDVIFKLIGLAQTEGWLSKLVAAAKEENPGNPDLAGISFAVTAGASVRESVQLEVLVSPDLGFLDLRHWTEALPAIERKVCAIELDGAHRGTGFLVGPDVVMTNYHVVEGAIADNTPTGLTARFDWSWNPNTGQRDPGTVYQLADDWLIDHSPYSQNVDKLLDPGTNAPPETELDYALLRLAPEPTEVAPDAPSNRGWISIPRNGHVFQPDGFLMIVQHPCGDDIKMAIDQKSILQVNGNGTRVRYRTNTQPGSSGSPCFNEKLELVALHHAGLREPEAWPPPNPCEGDPITPLYNQGVPISAIIDLITKRGKADLLVSSAEPHSHATDSLVAKPGTTPPASAGDATVEETLQPQEFLEAFSMGQFTGFDRGVVHAAVVTSENEETALQGERSIGLFTQVERACGAAAPDITKLCRNYWSRHRRDRGVVREFDPLREKPIVSQVPVSGVFESPENLRRAVRVMCWADIVVFDLTAFEPGVMFLLGVRAAVRRGVSICSLWRDDPPSEYDHVSPPTTELPFNIQNLTWSERDEGVSGSYHRTLIDLMKEGLSDLAELPHYLDLPAYTALRTLGTSAASALTYPRDEKVLMLCPFHQAYSERNFKNFLRPDLERFIGESVKIERLGDDTSPRLVSDKLYEAIRRTEMCVVDWTRYRPNVFMELGVRLATNKLGAVQILEVDEQPSPAPSHVEAMGVLFNPIEYRCEPGHDEPYEAMLSAFDSVRDDPDTDGLQIYQTVADAIDGSDPGHEPVDAWLGRTADLLQARDESREGRTQLLFVENRALRVNAEETARELRIAAWLYMEHRLGIDANSDPALIEEYKTLGNLAAAKLLGRRASEIDKALALEIYNKVNALPAATESELSVTFTRESSNE
jgi:hypothetical protein